MNLEARKLSPPAERNRGPILAEPRALASTAAWCDGLANNLLLMLARGPGT